MHGCSAIRNMPFVVEPVSISPKYIQWFGQPFLHTIEVELTGISTYSYFVLQNSFFFEFVNPFSEHHAGFCSVVCVLSESRKFLPFGFVYANVFDLGLTCFVDDFVLAPPIVGPFSIIEMLLLEDVSNLLLVHGSQSIPLQKGVNVMVLLEEYPVITLRQKEQLMNVTFIKDLAADQIPLVDHCEILNQKSDFGLLSFQLRGLLDAECRLILDVSFFESSFSFEILRSFVQLPHFFVNSPFIYSAVNDVIIDIDIHSSSFLSSVFYLNYSLISPSTEDFYFNDYASFPYQYNVVLNLSSQSIPIGENLFCLFWSHEGFKDHELAQIKIFNVNFSSKQPLSVYEPRDIIVDFVGILDSEINCLIQGHRFDAFITNGSLVCKNSILITFEPLVLVSIYYNELYINSFYVQGEAYIQDVCFLTMASMPLIDPSIISSNIDKNLIFDGSRCCNRDASACGEFVSSTSNLSFYFVDRVDILKIIVTTNGSCHLDLLDLDFDIVLRNETMSVSPLCHQIPSGFEFARMCEVDIDLLEVTFLEFSFHQDLYVLELEFYGYFSGYCLKPMEIGKGITLSGQLMNENVSFVYNDDWFVSFEELYSYISDSITMTPLAYLSYSGFLVSPNCYYSNVPYAVYLSPSEATQIVLVSNVVEFDRKFDRLLIPVICVDSIGFIVDCLGNFSIVSSTFAFSGVELFSSHVIFFSHNGFPLHCHTVELLFCDSYFNFNLTIVQTYETFLTAELVKTQSCEFTFFEKSCSLIDLSILYVIQLQLSNSSRYLSVFDVTIETFEENVVHLIGGSSLQIVNLPLQSVVMSISYLDSTTIVNVLIDDCPYPKINSGFGCLCVNGMYLDSIGQCFPCPVNFFSNSKFNVECRPCPFPRITLQTNSSDPDKCVCPLNSLDSVETCLSCPRLAECGYGNVLSIEAGFVLNNATFQLEECSFWYNCESNKCRSPHAFGYSCQYCTSEAVSYRIHCIGNEFLLMKILILLVLCCVILKTDKSLSKLLEIKRKYSSQWSSSDVSNFTVLNILKTDSQFQNFLFIFLFTVSLLFSKSLTFIIVFLEFVLSVFQFDYNVYLFGVFFMMLMALFSSKFWIKRPKIFKFSDSSFVTVAAMVSLNFIYGVIYQHIAVTPVTSLDVQVMLVHVLFVLTVLFFQYKDLIHFIPLLAYVLLLVSSSFELLCHLVIQTVILLSLALNAVFVERHIFSLFTIISVYFVLSVTFVN
ncbi:hypothetical protein GEMRC1_011073 [Eukaryota sp. GEM-RC1]